MVSLLEFWNNYEPDSIFIVSTAQPGGVEYNQNLLANDDSYCDLMDLLDNGLFPQNENGTQPWWEELEGQLQLEGSSTVWIWDGHGDMRDMLGNSYRRIEVRGH